MSPKESRFDNLFSAVRGNLPSQTSEQPDIQTSKNLDVQTSEGRNETSELLDVQTSKTEIGDSGLLDVQTSKSKNPTFQRTTVYLPKDLHKKFKVTAMNEEKEMSDIMIELIEQWLNSRSNI